MTDKEKEAIKSCNLLLNGDITLHIIDDDGGTAYAGAVNKLYNEDLETVLNLIQTQQEEIEKYKYLYQKALDNTIKADRDNLKKDKIIDEMARMLVEVPSSPSDAPMTAVAKAMIYRDLELHKWQVINYVRNKVEKENK